MPLKFPAACAAVLSASLIAGDVSLFNDIIRKTEPLAPADQLKTFQAPAGWKVQLVAAEPDINKPVNMAFDARGRLWVTSTVEYPYPAKEKGRDAIKVLEDFGPDGRARKVTTFATGLNIPIGLYPYKNGVVAYSIPNIYFFQDTDGDGKSDKQDLLYGTFGYDRDTHGMTSAFRRGFDGWLYACHGFNNNSTVKASDGSTISMHSGNTYRVKIDGSHVEQFTWGQVNPFGLTLDNLGNLYSADCHSLPVYLLLRGAYYPSFGKKDDGLGFGPAIMQHNHGSTAIGGIAFSGDARFPEEFQNNVFVGNVMTCRVNRDRLEDNGSTRLAKEVPDLLSTSDPWFRPVDLQLGPDGAIYVADFYNRIIGHYEVSLDHPGRDRERGRIWRIVHDQANGPAPNLAAADLDALLAALGDGNLTVRMLATDQLTDRIGAAAGAALRGAIQRPKNAEQRVHALWALHRLGGCDAAVLASIANDTDRLVRTHVMRVLSETPQWTPEHRALALKGLDDADAFVKRAAADALGRGFHASALKPLIAAREKARGQDALLEHTIRMALRNQFLNTEAFAAVHELLPQELGTVAEVLLGVKSEAAAKFIGANLSKLPGDNNRRAQFIRHAAQHIPAADAAGLAAGIREHFANDTNGQLALLLALNEELMRRKIVLPDDARQWIDGLAAGVFPAGQAHVKQQALELARGMNFGTLRPHALKELSDAAAAPDLRVAAGRYLLAQDANAYLSAVLALVSQVNQQHELGVKLAEAAGEHDLPAAREGLLDALRQAPARLQPRLSLALLRNANAGDALLEQVRAGKIPARLLLERSVRERLQSLKLKDYDARIAALTKGVKEPDGELQKEIDKRGKGFDPAKFSADAGAKVFEKTCAVCHQLDGKGALIGPQLDGVGARGAERLIEDILDPNRNVDGAFKYSVVKLKDGRILNGLQRREEGDAVVFADATGKEHIVGKGEIAERKESQYSLMPDNLAETLPPEDFNHLIAYLLSKSVKR